MHAEELIRALAGELDDGGLRGSFLVRDLNSGHEIGIEPDVLFPIASLVKVPLATVIVHRIHHGDLDGSTALWVQPGRVTMAGPTGMTRFRHPACVAIDDLLSLAMSISDNVAADALFELSPPAEVMGVLREWELAGITVRHVLGGLTETPASRFDKAELPLAHSMAIGAGTTGRGNRIPQLDVTRANSGSARAFVDLLQALWVPSKVEDAVAERVRELMANNLLRNRLAPDFTLDATTWSSKTGTFLNLRHEVGVVEHSDGQMFAIAALSESRIPAVHQPEAELLLGRVARALRDHLRCV